jgi:hypothetical protein
MWSSARFRRSANVVGLSSVRIQKSLKNCRTISRRRSISCLLGEASDVKAYLVALGPDRNAIGDRLFLCHGPQFHWGTFGSIAFPLTGQFLDELD